MHTVLELIKLSAEYFEKKNIESARLNAELLLAHVLSCKRLDLYLMFDKPIQETELTTMRELLRKRGERVPLQYLLGEVEFYGLPFNITPAALIPRPETELLVEKCLDAGKLLENPSILDIGCGSGIIAVCIAKHLSSATLDALDISVDAIALAKENAEKNSVHERISFIQADIKDGSARLQNNYDIIVSNPPYVSKEEYVTLQEEIVKHEPSFAITDSDDGYSFYRLIAAKSAELLKSNGLLFFEMGKDQSEQIREIMISNNFTDVIIYKDYEAIDRVIQGRKP